MKKSTSKTTTVSIEKEVNVKKYYYFLGFLVFFLFANTIGNGYNMDDELVTMNHKLTSRGLEAIADIFTSPYYSDEMGYAYGYRPMVHLSFAIEHQLFGEKAGISHLINVLLFTFSVILFFKLVRNWVGEKNTWIALVIAVLFAVHPIHTEAVASIKNRDEILAFLFVILAGLSIGNYFSKQIWKSLIFASLYFLIAMLSKKSVYSMVLILPFVFVLLESLSWKQVLWGSIALIIPGAVVASELLLTKMIFLVVFPMVGVFSVYFLNRVRKKVDFSWTMIVFNVYMWSALSLILVLYAIYTTNLLIVPIVLLLAAMIYLFDYKIGETVFSIVAVLIGIKFNYIELQYLTLTLLLFSAFSRLLIKEKLPVILIVLLLLTIFAILFYGSEPARIGVVLGLILFVFLILKRQFSALIFVLATSVLTLYISSEISYFAILISMFFGIDFISRKRNRKSISRVFPILFLCVLMISPSFLAEINFANRTKVAQLKLVQTYRTTSKNVKLSNQLSIKEGRMLEFAENTLVKPHTTQETIGTGFATLGEYLRLMIFPVELSFYYGFSKINTVGLNDVWVWLSIIVHVSLIVLAAWQIKKRPLITLGITWYLASILLFSNWVELVAGMVGERLVFTASAGFCVFLGAVIFWIKPSFSIQKPTWIEWTVLGIIVLFSVKTIQRNAQWKDALTLMTHDIEHLGNSAQANNLLALRLMQTSIENPEFTPEQRLEMQNRAIVHFDRAIALWPEFMNANFDKGRAAQIAGNQTKAIEGYRGAIRIDSTFLQAYFNLLETLDQAGKKKEYLQTAKLLFKQNQEANVYELLARGYFLNQQIDSATYILKSGIQTYPTTQSLRANLLEVQKFQ